MEDWSTTKIRGKKERIAIVHANQLLKKAESVEPKITNDLSEVVSQGTGKLEDMDFLFKGKDSLISKLIEKSNLKWITIEEYAGKITDVLRYTDVSEEQKLAQDYFKIIESLKNKAYNIIKVRNTFNVPDSVYRGINTLVKDKTGIGYVFELQFHTPESLKVNKINHKLYEEYRLSTTNNLRKCYLAFIMAQNSKNVPVSTNVEKIRDAG